MSKPTPQPESLRDAARSALAGGRWRTLADLADELGGCVPVDRAKQAADRIGRTGQKVPASNVGRIAFGRRRVVMDTLNQLAARREVEADGTGDDRRFRMATATNGKAKPATPAVEKVILVPLEDIDADVKLQPRGDGLDDKHVAEMVEWLAAHPGEHLPPVVTYHDPDALPGEPGHRKLLSEGFHRLAAYGDAGRQLIPSVVREGDRKAARLNAMASNQGHGLKRTNKDKRAAVEGALEESPEWTDGRIADWVGVGDDMVKEVRSVMESTSRIPRSERREGLDGKTYTTVYPTPSKNGTLEHPVSEPEPVADDPDDAPEPAPAPVSPPPPAAYVSPEPDDEPDADDAPETVPMIEPAAKALLAKAHAYDEFVTLIRRAESLVPELSGGFMYRATLYDRPLIEHRKVGPSLQWVMPMLAVLRRAVAARKPDRPCAGCGGRQCRACGSIGVLPADRSVIGNGDVTPTLFAKDLFVE